MLITRIRLRQIIKEEISVIHEAMADLATPEKGLSGGGGGTGGKTGSKKGKKSRKGKGAGSSPEAIYLRIIAKFKSKNISVTDDIRAFETFAGSRKSKWKHASKRSITTDIKRWMISHGHATSDQFTKLQRD